MFHVVLGVYTESFQRKSAEVYIGVTPVYMKLK